MSYEGLYTAKTTLDEIKKTKKRRKGSFNKHGVFIC